MQYRPAGTNAGAMAGEQATGGPSRATGAHTRGVLGITAAPLSLFCTPEAISLTGWNDAISPAVCALLQRGPITQRDEVIPQLGHGRLRPAPLHPELIS
jgi:hypothetical protein